jgi:hypothetical protein
MQVPFAEAIAAGVIPAVEQPSGASTTAPASQEPSTLQVRSLCNVACVPTLVKLCRGHVLCARCHCIYSINIPLASMTSALLVLQFGDLPAVIATATSAGPQQAAAPTPTTASHAATMLQELQVATAAAARRSVTAVFTSAGTQSQKE